MSTTPSPLASPNRRQRCSPVPRYVSGGLTKLLPAFVPSPAKLSPSGPVTLAPNTVSR